MVRGYREPDAGVRCGRGSRCREPRHMASWGLAGGWLGVEGLLGRSDDRTVEGMRTDWDDRARCNAAWYVDTSLRFDHPDMVKFFETGEAIVGDALDRAPMDPPAGGTAVEIGAGLGRVCLALSHRFDEVMGVDISQEMSTPMTSSN